MSTVYDREKGPHSFTVRNARRYRALVHLGIFERAVATHAVIAEKFAAVGFQEVTVVDDENGYRWAMGTRTGPDATISGDDLPGEIVRVDEV